MDRHQSHGVSPTTGNSQDYSRCRNPTRSCTPKHRIGPLGIGRRARIGMQQPPPVTRWARITIAPHARSKRQVPSTLPPSATTIPLIRKPGSKTEIRKPTLLQESAATSLAADIRHTQHPPTKPAPPSGCALRVTALPPPTPNQTRVADWPARILNPAVSKRRTSDGAASDKLH